MKLPGISLREGGALSRFKIEALWHPAIIVLAGIAVCGALAAAYFRGGWGDEYTTAYFANPAIPLGTAWGSLWPSESNPPFFYLTARLWQQATGPSLFAHRLVNLLPLFFLLAWFIRTARVSPAHRPFLSCYALLAFSSPFFLVSFPEYRSYFFQYCAGLVFVGASTIAYLDRSRRPDAFQLISLPFLITFHQVTSLYAGILLAPLVLADLRRRHYLRAASLAIVATPALIAIALSTRLQLLDLQSVRERVDWISPHGALTSLRLIVGFLPHDLAGSWVAIIAAPIALLLPRYRPIGPAASLIGLIATAAFIATLLLLAVNHYAPIVVDRYFTFLAVEAMAIISLAIPPLLASQRWVAFAMFVIAAIAVVHDTRSMVRDRRSYDDAQQIAEIVAKCPATRVHALVAGNAAGETNDQNGPFAMQYEEVSRMFIAEAAALYHLSLLPMGPDTPSQCPVVYWTGLPTTALEIEKHHGDAAAAANEAGGFGLDPAAIAHARLLPTYKNFATILVVEPWAP